MSKNAHFLLLIAILLFSNTISAQVYVAVNGSDNGLGTSDKPFKSLSRAIDFVSASRMRSDSTTQHKIVIKNGTYYLDEPLTITHKNRNEEYQLIIEGEKGTMPVFKGSIPLSKFEKVTDTLWKMDVSDIVKNNKLEVQQVFINGKRAIRARTPNQGDFYRTLKVQEIPIKGSNNLVAQNIFLTNEQIDALNGISSDDLKNVVISFNLKWDRVRGYINNMLPEQNIITLITPSMPTWINLENSPSLFFLENSIEFLDQAGEWYLDEKGILYYIPRKGEDIETTFAEIPILDELLKIEGGPEDKVNNMVFRNLSFQHTKYTMPKEGEMPQQAAANTHAAVSINFAKNITFEGCEIGNISNNAIWMKNGCVSNKIVNCYIHDTGIGGIKIGNPSLPSNPSLMTENNIIENNIIHSGGYEIPTGVGITLFHSGNNTISHNDIADFRYSGISVGWIWGYKPSLAKNNKIIYNHIHHLGWAELSDMGGVYTLGPSEGTEVSHNVIHDIYSYDYGGWGLYTDEGSTGITLENNLVYNCKSSAFHQHYGKENIVRNNIFANNIKAQLEATRKEDHLSFTFTNNIVFFNRGVLIGKPGWDVIHIDADKNLYWDTRTTDIRFLNYSFEEWKQKTGKDKNSVIADPMFVAPEHYDFRFKNKRNINKIGFKPFDYTHAGVYGDDDWLKKAELDSAIIHAYNATITKKIMQDGNT